MHISPKIFMVGAAGAAALSFVGVGAGAAFTSTATANGTAQTGHTGISLSTDGQVSCTSDGAPCDNQTGDAKLAQGTGNESAHLVLGTASNLGSSFSMSFPVTLTNSGTLNLKSGSVQVTDGDASQPGAGQALAKETVVTLTVSGLGQVASDTLYNLEKAAASQINFTVPNGSLAAGQSVTGTVTVTSQSGGLDNSAQSATVSPTLTITGSDA